MCPDQRPAKSPLSHKQGIWQGNEHRSSLEGHDDGSQDHFLAPFSQMAVCPGQKKKKIPVCTRDSQNRTTWWLCSDGRHYDWVCCHSLSPFFKLCGGLIKPASSLRPLMLQGSLIKSRSRKHTIHQLRTNYVDDNGWSVQSGNVPSCPWSQRNHEMILQIKEQEIDSYPNTTVRKRRSQPEGGYASVWRTPLSFSSLPHIPTLQRKSQLKVEWHDIPHAIYFCPPGTGLHHILFSPCACLCASLEGDGLLIVSFSVVFHVGTWKWPCRGVFVYT